MTKHHRRKRKKKSKLMSWVIAIILALFILALFTFIWDYLVLVAKPLLWITGSLLAIFLIFRLITFGQIGSKIGKKIGV